MKRIIAFLFLSLFVFIEVFGQTSGGGFNHVGGNNLASSSVITMDFGGTTVTKFTFVPSSPILVNPAGVWEVPLSSNSVAPSKIILEGASPTGSRIVKIAVTTNSDASVSTSRVSTDPGTGIGTFTFQMNPSNVVATSLRIYVAYENAQQNQNASENTFLLKSIVFQNASGNNTTVYVSPGSGVVIPITPTLGVPADNTTIILPYPFTWNSVPEATSYVFQFDTDQGFSSPISIDQTVTTTSYTVSNLAAGTYYWRVRANNSAGSSAFTTARSVIVSSGITIPVVPTLVLPVNSATNQPTTVLLDWNDAAQATSYRVQVMLINGTIVADQTVTTSTYTVSGLQNGTQYQWRVNATNSAGTSDWSTTYSFTTISNIVVPVVPTLISPLNGATNQLVVVQLDWNDIAGATSYRVQLTLQNGTIVIDQSNLTTSSLQVSGLQNGTIYYWRVNATNSAGTSDWSQTYSFTTTSGITIPVVPTLVLPVNSATNQPTTVLLDWNDAAQATSYRVQVMLINGTIVADQTVTTSTYTVSGLQNGTQYQWRVNATNSAGTSDWTNPTWVFTTGVGVPILRSPINNTTGHQTSLYLYWYEVVGASGYEIQVGTSSAFSPMTWTGTVTTNGIQLSDLLYATTYYWRVRAIGGEWSSIFNFMTRGSITGVDEIEIPNEFKLLQNYPNPFNPTTRISYEIPEETRVVIKVWDILGKEVEILIDSEKSAGKHEVSFDASKLSAGLYIYTIHTGNFSASKKMLLVK